MIRYTPEEKQFLKEFIPGHHHDEIRAEFEKRFRELTELQLKSFISNNGVNTGLKTTFRRGRTPWNKGKHTAQESFLKMSFKPGNVPPNYMPVGTEKLTKDGYIQVKVADPAKWELKHRLVWMQHYGKIPPGYIVVFRDGNRQNVTIDNLAMVRRTVHCRVNRMSLGPIPKEYFDTAMLIGEIAEQRGKRNHENDRRRDHRGLPGGEKSESTG